jgi:chromosome segregation ATPase
MARSTDSTPEEIAKWKPILVEMTHTRERVRAVADYLYSLNNEYPNPEMVRKKLSSLTENAFTPSTVTVQSEVVRWKEEEKAKRKAFDILAEHPAVTAEITQASQNLVSLITLSAQKIWEEEKNRLVAEHVEAIDKLEQAELKIATLDDTVESQQATIHQLNADMKRLTSELSRQTAQLDKARTDHELEISRIRLEAQERADAQVAAIRADLVATQEELKAERIENGQLRHAIEQERIRAASLEAQAAAAREENSSLKHAMESTEHARHAIEIELAALRRTVAVETGRSRKLNPSRRRLNPRKA